MDIPDAIPALKAAYESAVINGTPVALAQDVAFVFVRYFQQAKFRAMSKRKRRAKAAAERRAAREAQRAAEAELAEAGVVIAPDGTPQVTPQATPATSEATT